MPRTGSPSLFTIYPSSARRLVGPSQSRKLQEMNMIGRTSDAPIELHESPDCQESIARTEKPDPSSSSAAAPHECITVLNGSRCSTITAQAALVVASLMAPQSHHCFDQQGLSVSACEEHFSSCCRHISAMGKAVAGVIEAVAIVADHERMFTAHEDHKIRVWRMKGRTDLDGKCTTMQLLGVMPGVRECLTASLFGSNYVQERRHHKRLWMEHADRISALATVRCTADGEVLLYSGSWDRSVKVWRKGRCVESWRAHDDAVSAAAVSGDGRYLYTASADAQVKVWESSDHRSSYHTNIKKKKQKQTMKHSLVAALEGHRAAVNALAETADGALLFSGGGDSAILVWERRWCRPLSSSSSPSSSSSSSSSPSENDGGHTIFSSTWRLTGSLLGHRQAVLCLAAARPPPDSAVTSGLLCSGSADRTVRVWQYYTNPRSVHPHNSPMKSCCIAILQQHTAPVKHLGLLAVQPRSRYLALFSGSLNHDAKMWRVSLRD